MPLTQFWSAAPPHQTQHQTGQPDALTGLIDSNGRVVVMLNGVAVGTRRAVNLIPGTGITATVVNDSANEKVDVTLSAAAAGTQKKTGATVIGLSTVSTPSVRTGHILRVRARLTSGDSGSLVVWLYEGTTLRSGPYTIVLSSAFATSSLNIPQADASAITSYAALRVQVQGVADAGAVLTPLVSFVELEVPT